MLNTFLVRTFDNKYQIVKASSSAKSFELSKYAHAVNLDYACDTGNPSDFITNNL